MPGSSARSAYNGLISVNGPHIPNLERSQFVVPNKVIASVSYKIPWATEKFKSSTLVNLFYSGSNAYTYSYTYSNDMNNDSFATDLIYIPSGRGDINFISQADENAFFNFMEQDSYLQANKGGYAGANAAVAPWVHNFDFRLLREYYIEAGETPNTLQFSLDIALIIAIIITAAIGVFLCEDIFSCYDNER